MMARIRMAAQDSGFPDPLAGVPIQTKNRLRLFVQIGDGQKDSIAYDRGRSVTASGQGRSP
jgi:hypothetical protein